MAAVNFLVVFLALFMMTSAKLYKENMLKMVNNVIKQQVNKPVVNDEGSLKPCKKGDPEFQLTWTPKVIEAGDDVILNFDITPTVDLDGGTAGIRVYLPDYEDPIYQTTVAFTCEMINKVLPNSCPFTKGKEVKVAGYKFPIPSDVPIPGGTFVIMAEVNNKSGDLLACVNGTIAFKGQTYDYKDYNYNY